MSVRLSRRSYLNRVNSNLNISNREQATLLPTNMNSSFHNGLNQVASLEGDSNNLLKFLQENNRELSPSNNKHSLSNRNGIVFNQNLDIEKLLYVNKSEKGDKSYDLSNDRNKNNKKPEENLEFEFTISKSRFD